MGIDIYAEWAGQTTAEEEAQHTGFDATAGNVGYLREAYHGGPYVTKYLVAEAFDGGSAAIPAATLRKRLPTAVLMHLYREHKLYGDGKDPSIIDLDDLGGALQNVFTREIGDETHESFAAALTPASIETANNLIAERLLPDTALSFVDFVALCETKERETGTLCTIVASY